MLHARKPGKVAWRLLLCLILTPVLLQAQPYQVKEVKGGATISGSVLFKGEAPKPRTISVTKDKAIAHDAQRQVGGVSVKDGKLARAVVYLQKVKAGKPWPKLVDDGLVDQKGARFIVHSFVVPNGVKVPVRNSDPVLHNIHAYELIGRGRRTIFNKGQPKNMTLNLAFTTRRSPYVKIECDAHNFMHDYLFAASNPYYSVTGADGTFKIEDVPPGVYNLVVWHPALGEQKAKVKVPKGASVTHEFTFENTGG